jgi:hypothetical protein
MELPDEGMTRSLLNRVRRLENARTPEDKEQQWEQAISAKILEAMRNRPDYKPPIPSRRKSFGVAAVWPRGSIALTVTAWNKRAQGRTRVAADNVNCQGSFDQAQAMAEVSTE